MVMTSGSLAKDQAATFTLPVKAPYDIKLRDGQKANNSAAVSTGGKYTESSASSLVLNNVVIQGTAFRDYNLNSRKDGVQEPGIAGVTVRLYMEKRKPDGTFETGVYVPAPDYKMVDGELVPDGEITAVTDVYGRYRMEAYYAGNYKVVFERPANYAPTQPGSDQDPTASHIIPGDVIAATHETEIFRGDTVNYRMIRNAGYVYALGDLKITKQLMNAAGTTIAQGTRDVTYQVTINGQPLTRPNSVEIDATEQGVLTATTVTPDEQGRFTMKNGNIAWVRGLAVGDAYVVKELDAHLYDTTPATGSYTGAVKLNENPLPFTNKEVDNGALTITKVLTDSTGNEIKPTNRTFYFRAYGLSFTGTATTGGKTFELKAGESMKLEGLKYGSYDVYERADGSYNRVMPTMDYSLQYTFDTRLNPTYGYQNLYFDNRTPTVEVRNTERALGKLDVRKTLWDNAGIKLPDTRTFQYRLIGPSYPTPGQVFGINSNATSSTRFTTLKYGEYTLEEIDYQSLTYDRYDITYVHSDGKDPAPITTKAHSDVPAPITFTLTFDDRAITQSVEVQNKEKPLGKITVYKYLRTATGSTIANDTRPFTVNISRGGGELPENYPSTMTVSTTTPAVFKDLPYGTYVIEEAQAHSAFYALAP